MTSNNKRNIELHIEELVLNGFPSQDKNHIASAIQQELQRLLSQGALPRKLKRNDSISMLDSGTVQMEPNVNAESIGSKIARNLYGGLQQ